LTGQADEHVHLIEQDLKKPYGVSYYVVIGHNNLVADSAPTNHKGSAPFLLRKQIWGTCVMAGYTSVCD